MGKEKLRTELPTTRDPPQMAAARNTQNDSPPPDPWPRRVVPHGASAHSSSPMTKITSHQPRAMRRLYLRSDSSFLRVSPLSQSRAPISRAESLPFRSIKKLVGRPKTR